MPNAALLLADLLATWDVPKGKTVIANRCVGNDPHDGEFWRPIGQAITLLHDVEATIARLHEAGDPVADACGPLVADLYAFILPLDRAWNSTGPRDTTLSGHDLRALKLLGHHLTNSAAHTTTRTAQSTDRLRDVLEQTKRLVIESELAGDVKLYLLGLVAQIIECLDEIDTVGEDRLRDRIFTLNGALHTVADALDEKYPGEGQGKRWREQASDFFRQTFSGLVAGIGAAVVSGQIGG